MLRPPRIKTDKQKITRHCSQLAIKKLSHSRIASPRENDQELNNIRRTSFWMKKTMASEGLENLVPNAGKKPASARSRKVLSMKMMTQASEQQEDAVKATDPAPQKDINSKLGLIQKYQDDIADEVRILQLDKNPKLSHCDSLFRSLNGVLKMILKSTLKDIYPAIEKLLIHHIESSQTLFKFAKDYASHFVQTHKCEDLISKTIQLEREKNILADRLLSSEALIKELRAEPQEKPHEHSLSMSASFSLSNIDYDRLYMTNSNNYPKMQSAKKEFSSSFVCDRLFDRSTSTQLEFQRAKYTMLNDYMEQFMSSRQSFAVFRKFVEQIQTKNKTFSFNREAPVKDCHTEAAIFQILQLRFNFPLFSFLKKYLEGLTIKTHQWNVLKLVAVASQFRLLKDEEKLNEMFISLLRRTRDAEGFWLKEEIVEEVQKYICQGNSHTPKRCPLSEKSSNQDFANFQEQAPNSLDKGKKMKSKRLINCISLFQGKKYSRPVSIISKKPSADEVNTETIPTCANEDEGKVSFSAGFHPLSWREIILVLYGFIRDQLEQVEKLLSLHMKMHSLEEVEPLLESIFSEDHAESIRKQCLYELISVRKVCQRLIGAYGYSKGVAEEAREVAACEMVKIISKGLFCIKN